MVRAVPRTMSASVVSHSNGNPAVHVGDGSGLADGAGDVPQSTENGPHGVDGAGDGLVHWPVSIPQLGPGFGLHGWSNVGWQVTGLQFWNWPGLQADSFGFCGYAWIHGTNG